MDIVTKHVGINSSHTSIYADISINKFKEPPDMKSILIKRWTDLLTEMKA